MKVKLLLAKILAKPNIIIGDQIDKSITMSGGAVGTISFTPPSRRGYNVVGAIPVYNGSSSTPVVTIASVSNANINVSWFNTWSSSQTRTIRIRPIYQKLGGVLSNIVFRITHLFERRCAV